MNPRLSSLLVWLTGGLLIVSCAGCNPDKPHKAQRLLMGTLVEVTAVGPEDKAKNAVEAALDAVKQVEDLTSFHKQSQLTRVNEAAGVEPVKVDQQLLALVEKSLEIAARTHGAFDPTIGPLSNLWRFSAGEPHLPDRAAIASALEIVGWEKVRIDRAKGTVFLPERGMALDLGGIAKGYALDRAAAAIREAGIRSALVNAGGDIVALGEKEPGKPWRIGIQDPRSPSSIIAVAPVKDGAILTSGDYERFFTEDGKRYHHILDPKTGYPAEGLESVTILTPDARAADGMSLAVFVLGLKEGLRLIESTPGVYGLLVDSQGEIHLSAGAQPFFEMKR